MTNRVITKASRQMLLNAVRPSDTVCQSTPGNHVLYSFSITYGLWNIIQTLMSPLLR